jgi:hypothetical protein
MRLPSFLAAAAVLVAVSSSAPAAARDRGIQHFFFAPGTTTSCELDLDMPRLGTEALCQTAPHAASAILRPSGKLTICHGVRCIGNPPEGVPTLAYGAFMDAGPLRCTSLRAGVRCVVRATGHGFLIAPTSIKRV